MEFSRVEKHVVIHFHIIHILRSKTKVLTVVERTFCHGCFFVVSSYIHDLQTCPLSVILPAVYKLNTNQSHISSLGDCSVVLQCAEVPKLDQVETPSCIVPCFYLNVSCQMAHSC